MTYNLLPARKGTFQMWTPLREMTLGFLSFQSPRTRKSHVAWPLLLAALWWAWQVLFLLICAVHGCSSLHRGGYAEIFGSVQAGGYLSFYYDKYWNADQRLKISRRLGLWRSLTPSFLSSHIENEQVTILLAFCWGWQCDIIWMDGQWLLWGLQFYHSRS